MRFVADVMVGKLARWLRIMGYDVLYFNSAEDNFLIYVAKEDDRILLTRDRRLYSDALRAKAKAFCISSSDTTRQFEEVKEAFSLKARPVARCALCNFELKKVSKDEVDGLVPEFVWHRCEVFWRCSGCGKIYWSGTHLKNMVKHMGFDPWERE
ncbi:MAG: hypothetical protein GXO44_01540 [Deferribacteres bacterium]|nr:hypothetical protein [Deferribacteres bacterium]